MPYLELVVGNVSMVRSDVCSCLLLDLILSYVVIPVVVHM